MSNVWQLEPMEAFRHHAKDRGCAGKVEADQPAKVPVLSVADTSKAVIGMMAQVAHVGAKFGQYRFGISRDLFKDGYACFDVVSQVRGPFSDVVRSREVPSAPLGFASVAGGPGDV